MSTAHNLLADAQHVTPSGWYPLVELRPECSVLGRLYGWVNKEVAIARRAVGEGELHLLRSPLSLHIGPQDTSIVIDVAPGLSNFVPVQLAEACDQDMGHLAASQLLLDALYQCEAYAPDVTLPVEGGDCSVGYWQLNIPGANGCFWMVRFPEGSTHFQRWSAFLDFRDCGIRRRVQGLLGRTKSALSDSMYSRSKLLARRVRKAVAWITSDVLWERVSRACADTGVELIRFSSADGEGKGRRYNRVKEAGPDLFIVEANDQGSGADAIGLAIWLQGAEYIGAVVVCADEYRPHPSVSRECKLVVGAEVEPLKAFMLNPVCR